MRPRERRDSGQNDLFRARLDQIVDMNHVLASIANALALSGQKASEFTVIGEA